MRTYCIIAHGTLLNAQGDLHGKKIQKRGDVCLCMADSFAILI